MKSGECTTVLDIVFMIDSSQSMTNKEFSDTKTFISNVIPHLNPSSKGTHVGILAFANSANIKHSFTDVQDIGTIKKALDQIFLSGSANIVIAFNEAKRQINEVHGGEEHKRRRVLIVASNGKYPYPSLAAPSAKQLKDDGIVIISLGLDTGNVNKAQLESVATSKSHVITPQSTSDDSAMSELLQMICAVDRKPDVFVSRSAEESALQGHVIDTDDELEFTFPLWISGYATVLYIQVDTIRYQMKSWSLHSHSGYLDMQQCCTCTFKWTPSDTSVVSF
ncbi:collagen [Desmophyllum pertusum]|uniref:Collagen n=1 Tax=Desmophyllum pertusum TaxID=174260 RepID=A0A9X0D8A8_9CNID|nr:collagen [Desmophyllum pertusum]